jgi:hypothetical protein
MTGLWLVPFLLLPGCPHQQNKDPEPRVKVTVVVILAGDRCTLVDPLLKGVAAEVQKGDRKLTSFMILSMTTQPLPLNRKFVFACVDDCKVEVVVHQCAEKADKVCLGVTAPLQNEIVYHCVCGKFFLMMTRYQTEELVSPVAAALVFAHLACRSPAGQAWAAEQFQAGRCRYRLMVGVSAQSCTAK